VFVKIGIIGKGNVGTALGEGLRRAGHEVRHGHRDPEEPVLGAAQWGDLVILAVPFTAVRNVVQEIAPAVDGKVVIDVTNPLTGELELAIGFSTSNAEEVQKLLPHAHVVKAFNTVFAQNQSTGRVAHHQLTAFVAGNDREAKEVVMGLTREMGYDPVDTGDLKSARYLEPMGIMIIGMAYKLGMGTAIGYRLLHT
jgi:predicted dinucleotide-binding enzyme